MVAAVVLDDEPRRRIVEVGPTHESTIAVTQIPSEPQGAKARHRSGATEVGFPLAIRRARPEPPGRAIGVSRHTEARFHQ